MKGSDIASGEYSDFYANYIAYGKDVVLLEGLANSQNILVDFYLKLPNEVLTFSYAKDKWTPKAILVHLTDAERIFCYRALCIARGDTTNFPGFNENDYVAHSNASSRHIDDLLRDYTLQRQSTIALFASFSSEMLHAIGKANSSNVSVRALGFIILGHETHHINIIRERYLK